MAYQEGQTATNKKTGQRYVYRNGEWEELGPSTPDARVMGAQMPASAQGALTFGQGATFNMLDELAGAAALGQLGQSYAMGGTQPRQAVRITPHRVTSFAAVLLHSPKPIPRPRLASRWRAAWPRYRSAWAGL